MTNLKVYFPMVFLANILSRARDLGFRGTQFDQEDDVKYCKEAGKGLASIRLKEGAVPLPDYQRDRDLYGENEFPLTAAFFSSGMMSTSLVELLIPTKELTRLHVEFRVPLPGTTYADVPTVEELCPEGWDLMLSDPGKVMQMASSQFGTREPLHHVLARFSECRFIISYDYFVDFTRHAFLNNGKWASQRYLRAAFADPGWLPAEQTGERASQWYSQQLSQQVLGDESQTRIPAVIYNSPFWARQHFLPWRDAFGAPRESKRHHRARSSR